MTTTLLGRLHSTRQAATDARHTRERRPLHSRHTREGGYPAVRRGIRPVNSASPPRRRRTGRSSVAGMGAIQLDLRPRRFRRGGRNADYSTRQATLHSAGGHRRPSYPRKETFAQPSFPAQAGIQRSEAAFVPSTASRRLDVGARGGHCRRRGAIQLDLRPRRFRLGRWNDDYSTRQATLCSAGGHRRPSYPRKETFAQPSYPRRRVSSGPKRHSSHQQRLAASMSAPGAVIVAGRVPFSSTSHPVDSGPGAGMTTTLLGRLHSARQAATDSRHTREGGSPAVRSGIRPINSVSPPRRRRAGRSSVAGRGAIQLDLPTP